MSHKKNQLIKKNLQQLNVIIDWYVSQYDFEGVPNTRNILSNWSVGSRTPGNAGVPQIISINIQPTPHISNDVE